MAKGISWREENEDWRKALLICDCKSLVNAVGNSHILDEGIRLVHEVVARLNAERCPELLVVAGHCGLMGKELAGEEATSGSAEHQSLVALDPPFRRALIKHTCALTFGTTPLHAASYTRSPLQQEDVLRSKSETTDLRT